MTSHCVVSKDEISLWRESPYGIRHVTLSDPFPSHPKSLFEQRILSSRESLYRQKWWLYSKMTEGQKDQCSGGNAIAAETCQTGSRPFQYFRLSKNDLK